MKLSELLSEDNTGQVYHNTSSLISDRTPKKNPTKIDRQDMDPERFDPNYTPGKAALDREYLEVDEFTDTDIPNVQKELNDPRN